MNKNNNGSSIYFQTGFQLLPSISSLLPEISADNLEAKVDCIADVIRSVVKDDDEVATWSDDAVAEIQELKALQAENEKIENEAERFKWVDFNRSTSILE